MEYLIGALCAWFIISFIETETHILCGLLEFPMLVVHVVLEIVFFPFVFFHAVFLRHTIKPVSLEAVQKAKIMEDSKHLFGNTYICFDKKAKRLCNKVFLFRVDPDLPDPTKPCCPEGKFRIGT